MVKSNGKTSNMISPSNSPNSLATYFPKTTCTCGVRYRVASLPQSLQERTPRPTGRLLLTVTRPLAEQPILTYIRDPERHAARRLAPITSIAASGAPAASPGAASGRSHRWGDAPPAGPAASGLPAASAGASAAALHQLRQYQLRRTHCRCTPGVPWGLPKETVT